MTNKYPNLFEPIQIGSMIVPNRIAMMPMGVFSPRLANIKDGSYTKAGADYYIERAKGGTGMIVTGVIPIIGPAINPNNSPETYIESMKYLADGVHQYGSKLCVQFTALSGRATAVTNVTNGVEDPSVSADIPNVWDPTLTHPELKTEDIQTYVDGFANAASYAKAAGADAVEIHAVHEGYLLDQFTMSNYNHRTDKYGGSLENRLRFPVEIVKAIKEKCGKDFPVLVRYSVVSKVKALNRGALPGEEFEEFGRDMEESKIVAKMLQDAGYDALDCDNGNYDSWYWPHPPVYMPKACNLEDVKEIKKVVDIPVILAGKFDDPQLANEVIGKGEVDMMGMGRPLLADPELGHKFFEGREDDIRPCIGCHQGCLGRIFMGQDISCAVNPTCGHEKDYAITKANNVKEILVVGGGLGGMEAARVSALRGHHVHLYEKTNQLGGVFVAAAAPDFKEDDKRLLKWYEKQMKDLNIDIHLNSEVTKDMCEGYDEIFVATGASENHIEIPGAKDEQVHYAIEELLENPDTGDNVIVIGGGLTGCEIAYQQAKAGKKVTIVEKSETILNAMGLSAANYNMLMDLLDYYKVNVIKNATVTDVKDGKAIVMETVKNYPNVANRAPRPFLIGGDGMPVKHEIPVDHLIVSVGYKSDQKLYDEIKDEHVYLIGDAKKPTNVMDAIWSAFLIAKDI